MKVGDLVRKTKNINGNHAPWKYNLLAAGIILRIDKDFYGARTAIKRHAVGATALGKRDRVFILWQGSNWTYEENIELEVVSET